LLSLGCALHEGMGEPDASAYSLIKDVFNSRYLSLSYKVSIEQYGALLAMILRQMLI
jgi:hypothetical protein